MPASPRVASRLKPHISAILIAVLVFCYVDVFLAVRYSDKLPHIPSDTKGLDVEGAWGDLHQITRRPHPYNSHENDLVRAYLLRRLRDLSAKYPIIQYTSDETTLINTTYIDPPHAAYFESLNILVLIPGLDVPNAHNGGVLYSAHIDSVASGVGATDDGVGVVCILGLIEYFATHRAKRSVVFNLNDGEEDGLNGAMAFFKHPWSTIPDTFINFEGSGAGGRPIFFRSTSLLPLHAATFNTHAHANVLSGDAFQHRLLRSRTDFTVYANSLPASHLDVHYGSPRKPMQGIDLAFYKHRSYYHTKYDAIPYIEGGKRALWGMMDAGRGVGWELANRPFVRSGDGAEDGKAYEEGGELVKWGDAPVFFDLFNRHLVVFSRSTLFKLDLVVLLLLPLFILTAIDLKRSRESNPKKSSLISSGGAQSPSNTNRASCVKSYIRETTLNTERTIADFSAAVVSPEGRLFWKSLLLVLLSEITLVGLYCTFNPFVIYGRPYQVLATFFFMGVIIIGLCGYYYHPSPATILVSFNDTDPPPNTHDTSTNTHNTPTNTHDTSTNTHNTPPTTPQPNSITRLLINAYILAYIFTLFATILLYTAGVGGTYFLTMWGVVGWGGVMGEVLVGGFDGYGYGHGYEKGAVDEKGGKGGKDDKASTEGGTVELRRSLRMQAGMAAAALAASKAHISKSSDSTSVLLSAGDGSDATLRRNASVSPKKRGRPPKALPKKGSEVYVAVPRVRSPIRPTSSASASALATSSSTFPSRVGYAQSPSLTPDSPSHMHLHHDDHVTSSSTPESFHNLSTSGVDVMRTSPALPTNLILFTRMWQLFITVMVPVVLMCHIAQVVVDGMSQTLADGSRGVVVYAALALFGGLMAVPAAPWILAACFNDESIIDEEVPSQKADRGVTKSHPKSTSDPHSLRSSSRSRSRSRSQSLLTPKRTRSKRYSLLAAIPLGILVVAFQELTIKNMISSFPFTTQTPLKVFFQQQIEFPSISTPSPSSDAQVLRFSSSPGIESSRPRVTTLLVGAPKYIREIVDVLPSARGRVVRCGERADRKGTVGCEWDAEVDSGVIPLSGAKRTNVNNIDANGKYSSDESVKQHEWFDANITRTGPRSARFEVRGVNTRNCRIYFEERIVGFGVERVDADADAAADLGSLVDSSNPPPISSGGGNGGLTHEDAIHGFKMPENGVKLLVLWSRVWGARWVVDVQWPLSSAAEEERPEGTNMEAEERLKGRVACEWSEYDSARAGQVLENGVDGGGSSIPAFEEVLAFVPRWVSVSKLYHGMVEVGRGWEI